MLNLVLFKRIFVFVLYLMTALTACLFALLLVSNFINPALSQESVSIQKKESPGFKEILGDIIKNLKTIFKESLKKNEEFNKNISPENPPPTETENPEPSDMPSESAPPADPLSSDMPSESAPPADPLSSDMPSELAPPADPLSSDMPSEPIPPSVSSPSEAIPQTDQIPSDPIPESVPTEAQPEGALQTFMEDLSGVPSEWLLDIQSRIAPFIYEYGTQKDPFEDPTIKEEDETTGVIVIPKTPPEEYDLKEIKLKGIIWHTQNPKALFELPGSAGYYTLIKGDKIGKNGVIFEIREDEIVVVETNYIGKGKGKKEEIKIKIKKMDRLNLFGGSQQ